MKIAPLVSAGRTHAGRVRTKNEDAILVRDDLGMWVVADGLGGHSFGDHASGLLVERMNALYGNGNVVDLAEAFENALRSVNADLRSTAFTRNVDLIATTVVALLWGRAFMLCGWIGDSRAYCFEAGHLRQITRDHVESPADETLVPGLPSRPAPAGSAGLTRAVGADELLKMDWVVAPNRPGTEFLLCSDGINKEISDAELESIFQREHPPAQAVDVMFELVLSRRARDNASAIVVRLGEEKKRR